MAAPLPSVSTPMSISAITSDSSAAAIFPPSPPQSAGRPRYFPKPYDRPSPHLHARHPYPAAPAAAQHAYPHPHQHQHPHPPAPPQHQPQHQHQQPAYLAPQLGSPPTSPEDNDFSSPPNSPYTHHSDMIPLTLQERRLRNKAASAKYRQKKNQQQNEMRQMICNLKEQTAVLSRKVQELQVENERLRSDNDKLRSKMVAKKMLRQWIGRHQRKDSAASSASASASAFQAVRKQQQQDENADEDELDDELDLDLEDDVYPFA